MNSYPYFKRFIAFLIDWYLSTFIAAFPVYAFQSFNAKDLVIVNRIDNLPLPHALSAAFLGLTIYTLYFCVLPLKTEKRQTMGRKLLDLKLEKVNQTVVQFKDLFLRDFLGILLLQGNLTTANIYIMTFVQELTKRDIIPYYQSFYNLTVLLSMGIFFFIKKQQTLHDLISKTKVVEGSIK